MSETVTVDDIDYTPTVGEEEHGWCGCTTGEHLHHDLPRLGWGPVWCGSRRNADSYRTAVLTPDDRKRMHRVKRRYLVLRTAARSAT